MDVTEVEGWFYVELNGERARIARKDADALRKHAADASAAFEAATHVVPGAPTLGSVLGAAVDARAPRGGA